MTDAETLDDEPAIVEHRCLPMVEGGERKLPEVSTIEAGPLSFTALTCPNPWAPSETYFLTIDEANGWSLTIIDPKRDWSGYILAKPSFGPMAIQTDRLADGVALTLKREDLSWGTGSQEVYLFDSGGQLLGEPLVTSPGPVRVEDGALLATNTHTQPLPYRVGRANASGVALLPGECRGNACKQASPPRERLPPCSEPASAIQ